MPALMNVAAPVDGVVVEGRDGIRETTAIAPFPGHPRPVTGRPGKRKATLRSRAQR
jgi:hypothetical protein